MSILHATSLLRCVLAYSGTQETLEQVAIVDFYFFE